MRVLLIDQYGNALRMAGHLARQPGIDRVVLVAAGVSETVWHHPRLEVVVPDDLTIGALCRLARTREVDLACNLNSLLGSQGVVEQLGAAGIRSVGADRPFAETELNKRGFKHWLLAQGLPTPPLRFEGLYSDIEGRADQFDYPLVVKPDRQIGPSVTVCRSPADLRSYLDRSATRVPYARFGVVFLIEDYVPLAEHMHVLYIASPTGAKFLESVRTPMNWVPSARANECSVSVCPHPRQAEFQPDLDRFLAAFSPTASHAIGAIQCGITTSGGLVFLENNARPPTALASLLDDPVPCYSTSAVGKGGFGLVSDTGSGSRHKWAVALMHREPAVSVDLDGLCALPGAIFTPLSIRYTDSGYQSVRESFPSLLVVRGETEGAVRDQLTSLAPLVRECGPFLPIPTGSARELAVV